MNSEQRKRPRNFGVRRYTSTEHVSNSKRPMAVKPMALMPQVRLAKVKTQAADAVEMNLSTDDEVGQVITSTLYSFAHAHSLTVARTLLASRGVTFAMTEHLKHPLALCTVLAKKFGVSQQQVADVAARSMSLPPLVSPGADRSDIEVLHTLGDDLLGAFGIVCIARTSSFDVCALKLMYARHAHRFLHTRHAYVRFVQELHAMHALEQADCAGTVRCLRWWCGEGAARANPYAGTVHHPFHLTRLYRDGDLLTWWTRVVGSARVGKTVVCTQAVVYLMYSVFFQVCTALRSMHDLGWLHNDVKAENCFVDTSRPGQERTGAGAGAGAGAYPCIHIGDLDVACRERLPLLGKEARQQQEVTDCCSVYVHMLECYWVMWVMECMSTGEYTRAYTHVLRAMYEMRESRRVSLGRFERLRRSVRCFELPLRTRAVSGSQQVEQDAQRAWDRCVGAARSRQHVARPFASEMQQEIARRAAEHREFSLLDGSACHETAGLLSACSQLEADLVEMVCGRTHAQPSSLVRTVSRCIVQRAKASFDALDWALAPGVDLATLRCLLRMRIVHAGASGTVSIFAPELRVAHDGWGERTQQTDMWSCASSIWYIFNYEAPRYCAAQRLAPARHSVHLNLPECGPLKRALATMLEAEPGRRGTLCDIMEDGELREAYRRVHELYRDEAQQEIESLDATHPGRSSPSWLASVGATL